MDQDPGHKQFFKFSEFSDYFSYFFRLSYCLNLMNHELFKKSIILNQIKNLRAKFFFSFWMIFRPVEPHVFADPDANTVAAIFSIA